MTIKISNSCRQFFFCFISAAPDEYLNSQFWDDSLRFVQYQVVYTNWRFCMKNAPLLLIQVNEGIKTAKDGDYVLILQIQKWLSEFLELSHDEATVLKIERQFFKDVSRWWYETSHNLTITPLVFKPPYKHLSFEFFVTAFSFLDRF